MTPLAPKHRQWLIQKLMKSYCVIFYFVFPINRVSSFVIKFGSIECTRRQQLLFGVPESFDAFDFSSTSGWDEFYQEEEQDIVEWHSSIDLSALVKYVPKSASCLVVGCGNSALPRVLYDAHQGETRVTCLDSSSTCLDQLFRQHAAECPNMSFVCGDATRLSEVINNAQENARNVPAQYEVIVDKGLTDAILCGEGWNGPLEKLFGGACEILSPGGQYILVSYRLPPSTKEFLEETGEVVGLSWSFDLPESNNRSRGFVQRLRTGS